MKAIFDITVKFAINKAYFVIWIIYFKFDSISMINSNVRRFVGFSQ